MSNDDSIHKLISQTESEKRILHERGYKLTVKLGQGGYAKVYLTEFKRNENEKCIKLACKIIDTSDAPARFVTTFLPHELKTISKLNHPHIIQIHSILQRKEKYFIFMRHAENGDLLDYIMSQGPPTETQARYWTRQIALAVQYLHILEIAHRDIKCENILITGNNNIKLTDFGFARICVDHHHNHILSETFCGSISYVSPQILIGDPYDPKASDMWAFGSVIYVLLNKAPPFRSENYMDMYKNQMNKQYKFRAKYKSNYSKEAIALVSGLLEPIEKKRYKVEAVLKSSWFGMDPDLKILTENEYLALISAMEISKHLLPDTPYNIRSSTGSKRQSVGYDFDEPVDLNLMDFEAGFMKRLSA